MQEDVEVVAESSPATTTEPVETPQTTEQPQPEASATSESSEPKGETEAVSEPAKTDRVVTPPPKKSGAQVRIEQLLAENKRLKAQFPQNPQAKQEDLKAPQPPKETDFTTYEALDAAKQKYIEDLAEYKADQRLRAHLAQQEEARVLHEAQKDQIEAQSKWLKNLEKAVQRGHEDLADPNAIRQALEVVLAQPSKMLDEFLLDSEIGPDILVYLRDNPDVLEEIHKLPDYKVITDRKSGVIQYVPNARTTRELLKLEAKLLDQIKGIKPVSTPKPPSYVDGTGKAPTVTRTVGEVLYGRN